MFREYRTFVVSGVPIRLYGGPGIFAKGKLDAGTRLLLESLELPSSGRVLDLACGNGVIGIFIALVRSDLIVYMSDVDRRALELAKQNAKINNVDDRVVIIYSDKYSGVPKHYFNAIYSNPPLSAGWGVLGDMICGGTEHLLPGGFMEFVFAKGWEKAAQVGARCFSRVRVVKSRWGYRVLKFEL